MKVDGWILQIEELNTKDAGACFVSHFQLRSLEIKMMLLLFFFFKKNKQKSSIFLWSYVISFICVFSLFKKKAFAFCLHAWFSVPYVKILQSTSDFITYSVHEKNSNYFKYRICRFLLISILKLFTPNPSLPNLATHCIFLMYCN